MHRKLVAAVAISLLSSVDVHAQVCPLAGQEPMLIVQLFFGEDVPGKGPLSPAAWNRFLRDEVTPRFPDGLTISEAHGQWRDPRTHKIVREPSKVVMIAARDTPELAVRIEAVMRAYRSRFHQQSVGVVTSNACAAF
jgi:hypothetical protein